MKLTYKKGKGDKIHISIDGEYALTVDEMYFASLYLKDGQEISEQEYAELEKTVNIRRAYNCAVSLLSRRDHSKKELMRKLKEKGYSKGAEAAVEKLVNSGYVDDERFCRLYASELIRLKGYGRKRVEQELYLKGVDREIISGVLDEISFDTYRLSDIIKRKYLAKMTDEKGRQKAFNALLRLGYSYSEIRDALENMQEEFTCEVYDE
ncbi:MAG: regulatory protein RecX [Clostridia bacterium]|nr:regulatory protein RecX [Clostridia bacterium]